jgi:hypothetical protein
VPEQWLSDQEARLAYSLKTPAVAQRGPVPFDFTKAMLRALWPGEPSVGAQYWNHLCDTEAGEWIVKTVAGVEGFYFARPSVKPSTEMLGDPYGPEMPWIQRIFLLSGDANAMDHGLWFIQPPLYNYRFVEQPKRAVRWQAGIASPYIRLFGYTQQALANPYVMDRNGKPSIYFRQASPMQVAGIDRLASRFGYTWRGLRRVRDREHGIAGGEILIYDLETRDVLAVRRQFLITPPNRRTGQKAAWEIAAQCASPPAGPVGAEFTQFAFDVLKTIEPSSTRTRK